MKANIDDVNKLVIELHGELDTKVQQETYMTSLEQQGDVIGALCAENVVGRWIWKSGNILAGYAVPWEV